MNEDIEHWLDITPDKIKRNLSILTPEQLGVDSVLHISTNTNIKEFIPQIGHNQSKTEDRTIPRVCTAASILGCMLGYCRALDDVLNKKSDNSEDKYKGGWKIYSIPIEYCIEPNYKLVYDAPETGELWLVTYSQKTVKFIPEHAGNMFYQKISFISKSRDKTEIDGTLFIEVKKESGLMFSKNIFLKKGFWKIEGPVFDYNQKQKLSWTRDKDYTVIEITKTEYQSVKVSSADMLSFCDKIPTHINW